MQFNVTDIALVAVLILMIVRGLQLGFILIAGHLVSLVAGAIAAAYLTQWIGNLAGVSWGTMPWVGIVLFLLLLGIVAKCIMLAFRMINQLWRIVSIVPFLGPLNRLAGGAVGAVEGAVIILLVAYLSDFIGFGSLTTWLVDSVIFRYAVGIAERLEVFLPHIIH